jgi:hypothetical protein
MLCLVTRKQGKVIVKKGNTLFEKCGKNKILGLALTNQNYK